MTRTKSVHVWAKYMAMTIRIIAKAATSYSIKPDQLTNKIFHIWTLWTYEYDVHIAQNFVYEPWRVSKCASTKAFTRCLGVAAAIEFIVTQSPTWEISLGRLRLYPDPISTVCGCHLGILLSKIKGAKGACHTLRRDYSTSKWALRLLALGGHLESTQRWQIF